MNDLKILDGILGASPMCDLGITGCLGTATDRVPHPTGQALGEDWGDVWTCDGDCVRQAARAA
ncbi:hypothetical protein [Streptomyces anulatus]|uniref:hypothetical protein n=1 Tax=Streptomyces anulatus TaxID=1892 RepID=UPI001C254F07|nr:hypothetical protein [Streptomyces anulatus]